MKILDHNEHIKSDHFAINFDICIKNSFKRMKPQKRHIYNYKKANWGGLNELLLIETNWHEHIDYCDIHTGWENFKNILTNAYDRYIPKIVVKDDRQLPWFDAEVHKLCLKKERLRKQYKNSKSPDHYKSFSAARKKLKCLVKSKMRANLNDISSPNNLTKKFWSYVKSTSNKSRIPTQVHRKEVYANDSKKQADLFNEYFCDQFSAGSVYNTDINFENDNNFIDFHFYPDQISNILKDIDTNKSPGPDGITGTVLKKCSSLSYPLSILFNISFASGQLPQDWKLANVVPVHKKGDKADIENYRPISLTSLVMKVMEKIVRDELYSKCKDLINDKQYGFLPNKSCTTQMINTLDDIAYSLNSQSDVDIIYFDFAKAFDSVCHDKILEKLKNSI